MSQEPADHQAWRPVDDVLALVRRNAARRRDRRVRARAMTMPAILLVVAMGVVVARHGDVGGHPLQVATQGGTTTVGPAPATTVVGSTAMPATTVPATAGSASTVPPRATTTAPGTPAVTITVAPIPTTAAPPPACDQAKLAVGAATTDKASYRAGEVVTVTATLTNQLGSPCAYGPGYVGLTVRDAAGATVYSGVTALSYLTIPVVPPGQPQPFHKTWDQTTQGQSSTAAPTGVYTVTLSIGGTAAAPVVVKLVA